MALIKCSECGQKLDKNSTVCPNCGYKNKIKKCKKCGEQITDKVINFCPKCGTKIKNNKKLIIIGSIALVVTLIAIFIISLINQNSIKGQFDKLFNSRQTEFIFFERQGEEISDKFKQLLDTDLKEQGVNYTTIDLTNATYDDIEYLTEKLNVMSEDFGVYIAVVKNQTDLSLISAEEFDRAKFLLANDGLLKDNKLIVNEYYYNLGKEALDNGFLGEAKRNLDKCTDYADTTKLLQDKRFLLLDSDYGKRIENISMNGYNLIFSFKYTGGYDKGDSLFISKYECQGAYACLSADTTMESYDAKVIGNTIYIKNRGASEYDHYYTIESITDNTLKIKEISWTLQKNY